jgi:hypothetical protein
VLASCCAANAPGWGCRALCLRWARRVHAYSQLPWRPWPAEHRAQPRLPAKEYLLAKLPGILLCHPYAGGELAYALAYYAPRTHAHAHPSPAGLCAWDTGLLGSFGTDLGAVVSAGWITGTGSRGVPPDRPGVNPRGPAYGYGQSRGGQQAVVYSRVGNLQIYSSCLTWRASDFVQHNRGGLCFLC